MTYPSFVNGTLHYADFIVLIAFILSGRHTVNTDGQKCICCSLAAITLDLTQRKECEQLS